MRYTRLKRQQNLKVGMRIITDQLALREFERSEMTASGCGGGGGGEECRPTQRPSFNDHFFSEDKRGFLFFYTHTSQPNPCGPLKIELLQGSTS